MNEKIKKELISYPRPQRPQIPTNNSTSGQNGTFHPQPNKPSNVRSAPKTRTNQLNHPAHEPHDDPAAAFFAIL